MSRESFLKIITQLFNEPYDIPFEIVVADQ